MPLIGNVRVRGCSTRLANKVLANGGLMECWLMECPSVQFLAGNYVSQNCFPAFEREKMNTSCPLSSSRLVQPTETEYPSHSPTMCIAMNVLGHSAQSLATAMWHTPASCRGPSLAQSAQQASMAATSPAPAWCLPQYQPYSCKTMRHIIAPNKKQICWNKG